MTRWEYHIINIRSENYRLDPNAVGTSSTRWARRAGS